MGRKEKEKKKQQASGGENELIPELAEKKFNAVSAWALFVMFLALVVILSSFRVTNLDMGVHLRTGKMVLDTGKIPNTNIYSYTMTHREYVDHEWLFQTVAAAIYFSKEDGFPNGLIMLRIFLLSTAFVLLLLVGKRNAHPSVLFFVAGAAVIASSLRFYIRPEAFSLLFIAIFIFALDRFKRTDSPGKRILLMAMLVPVQIIWVNMHGFFIFGWTLILVFLLMELLQKFLAEADILPSLKKEDKLLDFHGFLVLGGALVVLFSVCFINPYGADGAMYPLKAVGALAEIFQKKISELKSPFKVCAHVTFKGILFFKVLLYMGIPIMFWKLRGINFWGRLIVVLGLFLFIIGMSEFRTVSVFAGDTSTDAALALLIAFAPAVFGLFGLLKINPFKLLLFSFFAWMAYRFNRNIGFFAFICLAVLPPILSDFFREVREKVSELRKDWVPMMRFFSVTSGVVVFAFLAYFVQMVYSSEFYYGERSTKRTGLGLSRLAYPYRAVEFVKKEKIHLLPGNMYNNFDTGNFLIWQLYPYKKVFIDGRTEVYGDFYGDIYYTLMAEPRKGNLKESLWYEKMKEYNVNFIIYKHSSNDIGHLPRRVHESGSKFPVGDASFKLVFFDQTGAVYLRDIPQNRHIIDKYTKKDPFKNIPAPDPEADPTEQAFHHNFLGRFMINVGRPREAMQEFEKAIGKKELEDFYNGLGATMHMTSRYFSQWKNASGDTRLEQMLHKEQSSPQPDKKKIEELKRAINQRNQQLMKLREMAVKEAQPAIDNMKRAIDMNPGYFEAHNNLHRIYFELGTMRHGNTIVWADRAMVDKAVYHLQKFSEMNYGLEPEQRAQVEKQLENFKNMIKPRRTGGRRRRMPSVPTPIQRPFQPGQDLPSGGIPGGGKIEFFGP